MAVSHRERSKRSETFWKREITADCIDLNDCKILKWPYCKFNTCGYGFLIIFVEHNGVRVAGISQDVISANCIDKFDEAIRFITNKANQLWNSTI